MILLAEIPVAFWAFWLVAGFVLFVGFAWATIRLAVRHDRAPHADTGREREPPDATERSGS